MHVHGNVAAPLLNCAASRGNQDKLIVTVHLVVDPPIAIVLCLLRRFRYIHRIKFSIAKHSKKFEGRYSISLLLLKIIFIQITLLYFSLVGWHIIIEQK
jgi:hypothetical protein